MSEEQVNSPKPTEGTFDVGAIFSKRTFGNPVTVEAVANPEKDEEAQEIKNPVAKAPAPEKIKEEETEDTKVERKEKVETKDIEADDSEVDYKSKIEKLEKTVKDTQRSFHEDRKKLAAYKRAVQKMVSEGVLIDSEAETLLDHTSFDESVNDPANQTALDRYVSIWDKELSYMKKYSRDIENIDQNIAAFQHLFDTSSVREKEDIMDELSNYEDDEVELTNQMLAMGAQYNEEVYSDIAEAGGLRKLKDKFRAENEILQNKLDKVTKQYNKLKEQYEDYDTKPANMRLQSGSVNSSIQTEKDAKPTVKNIFDNRFKRTKNF
jgi:hypothetical protein